MKNYKCNYRSLKQMALVTGLLFLSANAVRGASNIVINGGFEQGFTRWNGNLGVGYGFSFAAEGRNFGSVDGTIYQDLSTVPGQLYHLQFALAGNFNITLPHTIELLWDGAQVGSASWSPLGHNVSNPGWVWTDLDLTAGDASTRLAFRNPYGGDGSQRIAIIDAISVTVVPEPTGIFFIGIAMFAAFKWSRQ